MPDINGGMARYNLDDPEDMQVLIRTGLIWKGGPKAVQKALRALQDGTCDRVPVKETPEVNAYLTKLGVPEPSEPNEDAVGPGAEPTDLDDEEDEGLGPA